MKTKLTLAQLRSNFWQDHPELASQYRRGKRQNEYPTDTRVAWCDYIEAARSNGDITDRLVNSATL